MIGKIRDDHPISGANIAINEDMAPLLPVSPRTMLAKKWNPAPILLKIDPISNTLNLNVNIISSYTIKSHHCEPPILTLFLSLL
jgi:hypothetical protein